MTKFKFLGDYPFKRDIFSSHYIVNCANKLCLSKQCQVYSLFVLFPFRMPVSDSLVPFVQAGGSSEFGADFAAPLDDGDF